VYELVWCAYVAKTRRQDKTRQDKELARNKQSSHVAALPNLYQHSTN
jgi:hypothetical protein